MPVWARISNATQPATAVTAVTATAIMLRLFIVLCLLLPYIGIMPTARVILFLPADRTFGLNGTQFFEELFGNATDMVVWPNFQWPEFTMPTISYDFFTELSKTIRNIFKVVQNHTMAFYHSLNDTFTGNRKKPVHASAYNFVLKPFGNFSFSFGFSFNFQSSGNFGHAKMNFYEILSENQTEIKSIKP